MNRKPSLAFLRRLKNGVVHLLLKPTWLRRWLAWGLRSEYYPELGVVVPLSTRVVCPIPYEAAWSSFHEIFLKGEYGPVFAHLPLPRRWLDLGCYAGFFTAYVMMLRDRAELPPDFSALLVDADRRSALAAARLAEQNGVSDRIQFLAGALASGEGHRSFVERPYMSSSLAELNPEEGEPQRVPVLAEAVILARFPPPYDLVKLDIEGAEMEFLRSYPSLLRATRHLVIEWHHWPGGGVDAAALRECLAAQQFSPVAEIVPAHPVGAPGSGATCGVILFANQNPPATA